MNRFADWGNALYTGRRAYPFVRRWRLWFAIAAALLRWSAHPAERFVWTTVALTVASLVPPLVVGADTATTAVLIVLHLVAATVMIPTLARALRAAH